MEHFQKNGRVRKHLILAWQLDYLSLMVEQSYTWGLWHLIKPLEFSQLYLYTWVEFASGMRHILRELIACHLYKTHKKKKTNLVLRNNERKKVKWDLYM